MDINGGGVGSSPTRGGKEESVNINVYRFFFQYCIMKKIIYQQKRRYNIARRLKQPAYGNRKKTGTALPFYLTLFLFRW